MKIITAAAVIAYFGVVGSIDTPEWQPSDLPVQLAVCAVSYLWLVLFGIVNNWFYEDEREEDEPWDM